MITKKPTTFLSNQISRTALSHVTPPHRLSVISFEQMEFVLEIFSLITALFLICLIKAQTREQCHKLIVLFAILWGHFSLEGNLYVLLGEDFCYSYFVGHSQFHLNLLLYGRCEQKQDSFQFIWMDWVFRVSIAPSDTLRQLGVPIFL
ncbi:Hypothetical_protein [Hexamita inflata]|uniref:Hypothetical_protein n=1 Tax=Hexamita inflata TaxID=28002 RepID=A0AA86Q0B4_9EUKA|nr:Hypothetical protein HINF_LOCUS31837 [Hexamita inflata]